MFSFFNYEAIYTASMPIFHLHLYNETLTARDDEGREFMDIMMARTAALEGIRDFISHEVKTGKIDLRGRIEIADEAGRILEKVQFKDAFVLFGA